MPKPLTDAQPKETKADIESYEARLVDGDVGPANDIANDIIVRQVPLLLDEIDRLKAELRSYHVRDADNNSLRERIMEL